MYIWELLQENYENQNKLVYRNETYKKSSFSEVTDYENCYAYVNTISRLKEIFDDIVNSDNKILSEEMHKLVIDLFMHYISNVDLLSGFNVTEIKYRCIEKDIQNEFYGEKIKSSFKMFSYIYQRDLLKQIYDVFQNGVSIEKFKEVFYYCNEKTVVFEENEKLFIYCDSEENIEIKKKFDFIVRFFLPVNYKYEYIFKYHPYVIGIDCTAEIEKILIV